MATKRSWDEIKRRRMKSADAEAGYEAAKRAYEIGAQVRKLREKAGMSQSELARRMGSTQPAIARLEAGGVSPSIETLDRVAAAVGSELSVRFVQPKAS